MHYSPAHAARALQIMEKLYPSVSTQTEYLELIAILQAPSRWKEAHAAFGRIRGNITLPQEALKKKGLDSLFFYVAENAAKTAYNCSGAPMPFDDDRFEWLLKCEAQFREAYAAIHARPDTPEIPCSPRCDGSSDEHSQHVT